MRMKRLSFLKILIPTLFFLSILIIVWIDFIPFKLQELWLDSGQKFEKIIYSLSSSYIASYIFYIVVVYWREKVDRKRKREEFHTHIFLYLNKYHEQLKELLEFDNDIIIKTKSRKPYELPLEKLVYIFQPPRQFSLYTQHSDEATKAFLQNRTKRYRNYFYALKKLIECIKLNHHLLDFYEDNEVYEMFHVFIILNEEENFEEQLDQRANTKQENSNKFLFEKDIEEIKYFSERIKDEKEYAYPLELNSKEYLALYYRFKNHLELNIGSLRSYQRMIDE